MSLLVAGNKKEENAEDEAFNKIIRRSSSVEKLDESLPRFGPFYGDDQQAVLYTKKKAWQHVKKKWSSTGDFAVGSAKEIFAAAVRRVEKEAKDTYGLEKITGCTGSKFRLMMVKDGCFFLQLAFLILDKSKELGYSENDLIFGKKIGKRDIRKWIKSMFYVGNQIPFVVLQELMKEKFFRNMIDKINWDHDHPPSALFKKVFYDLLVLPPQPGMHCYHLLHGLRKLVVGPPPSGYKSAFTKDQSQEEDTNEDDFVDLEANINNIGIQVVNGANGNHKEFPSATELKQAYIFIKKLKNGSGIRRIYFQSYYMRAYIYLPVLTVDDYMEILFDSLKTYEISNQKHQQVSSYLRFMSDIIQKPEDVKLLKKEGIIEGDDDAVEKLPRILKRLVSSTNDQETTMTQEFHILKRKINDYSSPWVHYQGIINLVVILTLLQSLFAVLSYFNPPSPNDHKKNG